MLLEMTWEHCHAQDKHRQTIHYQAFWSGEILSTAGVVVTYRSRLSTNPRGRNSCDRNIQSSSLAVILEQKCVSPELLIKVLMYVFCNQSKWMTRDCEAGLTDRSVEYLRDLLARQAI